MLRAACILVISALMVAAAPLTQPVTRPSAADRRLHEIIERLTELDSPDPAVRRRATEKLIAIGPAVLEPIAQLLQNPVSPELAARARLIQAEIPRRWEHISRDAGPIEAGFQSLLKPAADSVAQGKSAGLVLEIRNAGGVERRLPDIRAFDIEVAGSVRPATSEWGDARICIRRVDGAPVVVPAMRPIVLEKTRRHRAIDCRLGASVTSRIDLADAVELPPGEYEVKVVYFAESRQLLPDAFDDLTSNAIRISVTGN